MNTEADRRAKALEDAVREALLWRQERLVPICLGTTAYHQALAGLGELVLRRGAIDHLDDLELVLQTGRENDRAREVLASAALREVHWARQRIGAVHRMIRFDESDLEEPLPKRVERAERARAYADSLGLHSALLWPVVPHIHPRIERPGGWQMSETALVLPVHHDPLSDHLRMRPWASQVFLALDDFEAHW